MLILFILLSLSRVYHKYFQVPNTLSYFNISWFFQIAYFLYVTWYLPLCTSLWGWRTNGMAAISKIESIIKFAKMLPEKIGCIRSWVFCIDFSISSSSSSLDSEWSDCSRPDVRFGIQNSDEIVWTSCNGKIEQKSIK